MTDDDDDDDDDDDAPVLNLGSCCSCGKVGRDVCNIVTVAMRSPEPGPGCWGCVQCGLPDAGAVCVVCNDCITKPDPPAMVCLGYPGANRRAPRSVLTEPFDHIMELHPEAYEPGSMGKDRIH